VRRNTAVGNLRKVIEAVERCSQLGEALPIAELWVHGDHLEHDVDSLEVVEVVFVVDLPTEEVTWLAVRSPPSGSPA